MLWFSSRDPADIFGARSLYLGYFFFALCLGYLFFALYLGRASIVAHQRRSDQQSLQTRNTTADMPINIAYWRFVHIVVRSGLVTSPIHRFGGQISFWAPSEST